MSESCPLQLASRIERKWFARTLIASGLSLFFFFLLMGMSWWGGRISASMTTIQPASLDQELDYIHMRLLYLFYAMSGSIAALIIFGTAFLGFFFRWMIALRVHRRETARLALP